MMALPYWVLVDGEGRLKPGAGKSKQPHLYATAGQARSAASQAIKWTTPTEWRVVKAVLEVHG